MAATNEYRQEMDPVAAYVGDRCKVHPDAWTLSKELFKDYEAWAEENGERHALNAREFSKHLVNRYGCEAKSRRHAGAVQRGLSGIGLLSDPAVDVLTCVDGTLSKTAHVNLIDKVTQNGVTHVNTSTQGAVEAASEHEWEEVI